MPDYPQTPAQKSKTAQSPSRGGVFQRALVRELTVTGLGIFFILLVIFVFTQLIRLLGDSASGLLTEEGVWPLVGFGTLNVLPTILAIGLFLSVLLTLSRSYRDSEMVVWFSSGIGLTHWIRPIMAYALPVVLVIALLSLVLTPWARLQADEYKNRMEHRDDVSMATPGAFRESRQDDRVFFLEQVDTENKRIENIFVRSMQQGREGVMVAREGFQEFAANGDRFLVLLNGKRYEGVPGEAEFRIITFDRYAMRIEPLEMRPEPVKYKAMSTLALLSDPTPINVAEVFWRFSLPLSALLLALLAIPLGFVNPRAGRSFSLIIAMVVYMMYSNLLNIATTWIGNGKTSVLTGTLGVHGMVLLVLLLAFYYRIFGFRMQARAR